MQPRRLLGLPAALDGGELGRLMLRRVLAVQMAEDDLHGDEDGGQAEPHVEHCSCLGPMDRAQQVPGAGRGDAEGGRQIGAQQHVEEADPHDVVGQDDPPTRRREASVDHLVSLRDLHPGVVGHDPERRQRGAEGDQTAARRE